MGAYICAYGCETMGVCIYKYTDMHTSVYIIAETGSDCYG